MAYWLVKSEPKVYAWERLVKDGSTLWDDVRNVVARNNLKAMKKGDKALFYHSNEGLCAVGIAEVVEEAMPDVTVTPDKLAKDGSNPWVVVRLAPVQALAKPVTMAMVKAEPWLKDMALVKYSRLSVQPVTPAEWRVVMELGGMNG
jgi:predicted RNA-binding protein with PUA-like domain